MDMDRMLKDAILVFGNGSTGEEYVLTWEL